MRIELFGRGKEDAGDAVSRSFDVQNFNSLNIAGVFTVVWKRSQSYSLVAQMPENLFDKTEIKVENNVLYVNDKRKTIKGGRKSERPILFIGSPELESVFFGGLIKTKEWDTVKSAHFVVNAEGAVSLDLPLEVRSIRTQAEGAAKLTLKGSADQASILSEGASLVAAENLQTKDAVVKIEGAGKVTIACWNRLEISIEGVGTVKYFGNPVVVKNIEGFGSVKKG